MNINNKIKQFFGGNWGHPRPFTKRHTEIPKDFFSDEPVKKTHKKKKKKRVFRWTYESCPFCDASLPRIDKNTDTLRVCWPYKFAEECECGAKKVKPIDEHVDKINACPCCGRDTWFKDDIYKHQDKWSCGFVGERKNDSSM